MTAADVVALTLNGEAHSLVPGSTVLDLVTGLGFDPRTVAVERNGELVPRALFAATVVLRDDRIEIVRFVQGGVM